MGESRSPQEEKGPQATTQGCGGGEAAHCPDFPAIGGHGADFSQELSVPSQARQNVAGVPGLHLPPPLLSL